MKYKPFIFVNMQSCSATCNLVVHFSAARQHTLTLENAIVETATQKRKSRSDAATKCYFSPTTEQFEYEKETKQHQMGGPGFTGLGDASKLYPSTKQVDSRERLLIKNKLECQTYSFPAKPNLWRRDQRICCLGGSQLRDQTVPVIVVRPMRKLHLLTLQGEK